MMMAVPIFPSTEEVKDRLLYMYIPLLTVRSSYCTQYTTYYSHLVFLVSLEIVTTGNRRYLSGMQSCR